MRSWRSTGEYSPSLVMRKGSESILYEGSPWIAASIVCNSESVGAPGCGGGGMGAWEPGREPWRSVEGRSSRTRCSVLSPLSPAPPPVVVGVFALAAPWGGRGGCGERGRPPRLPPRRSLVLLAGGGTPPVPPSLTSPSSRGRVGAGGGGGGAASGDPSGRSGVAEGWLPPGGVFWAAARRRKKRVSGGVCFGSWVSGPLVPSSLCVSPWGGWSVVCAPDIPAGVGAIMSTLLDFLLAGCPASGWCAHVNRLP